MSSPVETRTDPSIPERSGIHRSSGNKKGKRAHDTDVQGDAARSVPSGKRESQRRREKKKRRRERKKDEEQKQKQNQIQNQIQNQTRNQKQKQNQKQNQTGNQKQKQNKSQNLPLPAWYYRVLALSFKEDREIYPEDFDEDISDLDNDDKAGYDGDSYSPDEDDSVSNRSYDGSDADCYYELKEERESRKLQLEELKKEKEGEKEFQRRKAREVQNAYDSLEKRLTEGGLTPPISIVGTHFTLYSADHVEYCYDSFYSTKYVEFYHLDERDFDPPIKLPPGLHGHIYFGPDTVPHLAPFSPPTHASLEDHRLGVTDGKDFAIKFLSNDHLMLKVSREAIFQRERPPADAPNFFEFYGVRFDREKAKAEMEREMVQEKQRSPSPRESWFEMNHPMGSWNQSRGMF